MPQGEPAVHCSAGASQYEDLGATPRGARVGTREGGTRRRTPILLLAGDVQTEILKIVQQTAKKTPFDSSRFSMGGRVFEQ